MAAITIHYTVVQRLAITHVVLRATTINLTLMAPQTSSRDPWFRGTRLQLSVADRPRRHCGRALRRCLKGLPKGEFRTFYYPFASHYSGFCGA